jgi:hypothetical protein
MKMLKRKKEEIPLFNLPFNLRGEKKEITEFQPAKYFNARLPFNKGGEETNDEQHIDYYPSD